MVNTQKKTLMYNNTPAAAPLQGSTLAVQSLAAPPQALRQHPSGVSLSLGTPIGKGC